MSMEGKTVKIKGGQYQGGAGVVNAHDVDANKVTVYISGIINEQNVQGEFEIDVYDVELM